MFYQLFEIRMPNFSLCSIFNFANFEYYNIISYILHFFDIFSSSSLFLMQKRKYCRIISKQNKNLEMIMFNLEKKPQIQPNSKSKSLKFSSKLILKLTKINVQHGSIGTLNKDIFAVAQF